MLAISSAEKWASIRQALSHLPVSLRRVGDGAQHPALHGGARRE